MYMMTLKTESGNFRIRALEPRDKNKVLALFKEVFGVEKDITHWEWEFLKNPYGTQGAICESEDGELVAQCATIPAPLYYNGKKYLTAQLVDCMSKKNIRNITAQKKGLFSLTVQHFFDTFAGKGKDIYLYGFPGVRHFRLGSITLGYKKTRSVREILIKNSKKNIRRGVFEFNLNELSKYSDSINQLSYTDASLLKFCILKEYEYLKWRYLNAPKNYKVLGVKNIFGRLKLMAVFLEKDGELIMTDFWGIKNFDEYFPAIVGYLKRDIKLWIPKNSLENVFENFNIQMNDTKIPVVPGGMSFWGGLDETWANENFFYTMGDCDLF